MKILLVNDYATATGGAELLMLSLRDRLRDQGHDARLFASSARPGPGNSLADYTCFGTTSRFRTLLQTANPWAYWQFRRVLAEFCPEVVHVGMFLTQLSPFILPLLKDVPSLYHVHWYRPICPLGTKTLPDGEPCKVPAGIVCYDNHCLPLRDCLPLTLQMKIWKRWRNSFNLIVANSEAARRRLIAESIEPVEVLQYGMSVQPFRPPLSLPQTVVYGGRLVWQKGVDLLIHAFAQVVTHIPDAQLLIAGEGPEREKLTILMKGLGLSSNVFFTGHLSRTEVERQFAKAWVQAVPSRWAESFGLVAAEAMMRGTAVVASKSDGLTEIVRSGQTGLLVTPGDVNALAQALLRLLRDRALAEEMGRAGREVALTHFNEADFVNRCIQLYVTLCKNAKHNYVN